MWCQMERKFQLSPKDDVSLVSKPEATTGNASWDETSELKSLFWGAMHNLSKPNAKPVSSGSLTSVNIVESYLAEASTDSLISDPAVTFWSTKGMTLPALAEKYLTCPRSVSSESLFSTTGYDVSPYWSRIQALHVEEIVFTIYSIVAEDIFLKVNVFLSYWHNCLKTKTNRKYKKYFVFWLTV